MIAWIQRHSSKFIVLILFCLAAYGVGRLYFQLTAGFTIGNISSDLSYNPQWDVRHLSIKEQGAIRGILSKEFRYLGKGCQSYVFISDDGEYVLKFLKYQRFRPQKFLGYFSFIPLVEEYRQNKILKKQEKLDKLFNSWKISFNHLRDETGLVFVHLNKTDFLKTPIVIYDKMGLKHSLDADQFEFLIQRRAKMLCPTIDDYMKSGDTEAAKALLVRLIDTIISEYRRGFADNDHALMQNTGVIEGYPVHIDVGQFTENEKIKDSSEHNIELFSKTYKFRIWLAKKHPELETFLTAKLLEIIGPEMAQMKPRLKTVDEGA